MSNATEIRDVEDAVREHDEQPEPGRYCVNCDFCFVVGNPSAWTCMKDLVADEEAIDPVTGIPGAIVDFLPACVFMRKCSDVNWDGDVRCGPEGRFYRAKEIEYAVPSDDTEGS